MGYVEPTSGGGEVSLSRRKFIVTGLSATGGLMLGIAYAVPVVVRLLGGVSIWALVVIGLRGLLS